MARRKEKNDSESVSKKTDSPKPNTRKSTEKNSSQQDQGSWSRFLGFFIPGVGFGGAFLLISALVMAALYWFNHSYFPSDNPQSWQVEYNLPQGAWTGEDVLEFVKKNNPELFEKTFDDKTLLEDVSNSFNLSPIVKQVKSAQRRYPNSVVLDIEYFEPVAMVYIDSETMGKGYIPVDKDGIQLPTSYFNKSDLDSYLSITGIKSLPMNPVRHPWNDLKVEAACQIAYELTPYKEEFGIVGIYVHESSEVDERYSYNPVCFDIWLKNHTFIRWSRSIFKSTGVQTLDQELSTEDKIALLRQRLKERGEIKPDSPDEMFRFTPEPEPELQSDNAGDE